MGDVEQAGLLKMDFLGLRNLTILAKAVELIEQIARRADRSATSSRSTTPRRSPCSAAARRRASSSSKAAAFATCCSG